MSGAAGLSAAKRRRGPQGGSRQPTPAPAPPAPQETPTSNSGGLSPMQLLQQHHQRLGHIEQAQTMFAETLGNMSGATGGDDGVVIESVNEVRGRVDAIEKEMRVRNDEPPEDLAFFREKTIKLEKQVSELKQMMMKIQTFAMETNFTLLKYKNGMDAQLAAKVNQTHAESNTESLLDIEDDGTFDDDDQNGGEDGGD